MAIYGLLSERIWRIWVSISVIVELVAIIYPHDFKLYWMPFALSESILGVDLLTPISTVIGGLAERVTGGDSLSFVLLFLLIVQHIHADATALERNAGSFQVMGAASLMRNTSIAIVLAHATQLLWVFNNAVKLYAFVISAKEAATAGNELVNQLIFPDNERSNANSQTDSSQHSQQKTPQSTANNTGGNDNDNDDDNLDYAALEMVMHDGQLCSQCFKCKKAVPMADVIKCESCSSVYYCSDQCRQRHFKKHRNACEKWLRRHMEGEPRILHRRPNR